MGKILKDDFYAGTTEEIARQLLGKFLCRRTETGVYVGKIVEDEAYLGKKDLACHSARGKTKRTETMFGSAGYAYVYMIYGIYHCLNIVTQKEGVPEAILIRALEPVMLDSEEINAGQEYYGNRKITSILNGPGKLCREFMIEKELNGAKLSKKNDLWIEDNDNKNIPATEIVRTKRIGVEYAKEWRDKPLRFYIRDSPFVSKK